VQMYFYFCKNIFVCVCERAEALVSRCVYVCMCIYMYISLKSLLLLWKIILIRRF
jgi:hypothetical protein